MTFLPTPSKPFASSIAATFFAYRCRVELSFAPAEKPSSSPQPPIAIISLVSGLNRERILFGDSKGVNDAGESELNSLEGAKAMMAWSMYCVWFLPGKLEVWYLE